MSRWVGGWRRGERGEEISIRTPQSKGKERGGTKGEEKLESTERGESYETGRRAGVFLTGCWRSVNISLKKNIEVIFPT